MTPARNEELLVLLEASRFDEAEARAAAILRSEPDDRDARTFLALAWQGQGKVEQAASALMDLLEEEPTSANLWFYCARCAFELGGTELALDQLDRAIQCDPNHVAAY